MKLLRSRKQRWLHAPSALALPVVLSVSGLAACAPQSARAPDDEASAVIALPACSLAEGGSACVPGPALAAPIIVGPGKLRALVAAPFAGASAGTAFRLFDIDEERAALAGQGNCLGDAAPESLALTAAGKAAVLCRGTHADLAIGVFDSATGRVTWQAQERLALPSPAWHLDSVPYFAELAAEHWAFVYRQTGQKGAAAPLWMVQTTHPAARALCSAGYACEPRAVLVIDGRLHVLRAEATYAELVFDTDGGVSSVDPPQQGLQASPVASRSCVAADLDGSVSVLLTATPAMPTSKDSARATLAFHYPRAFLPLGPDVFPSAAAICPPASVDDPQLPAIPRSLRRFTRATLGKTWVIAYVADEVGAPAWKPPVSA